MHFFDKMYDQISHEDMVFYLKTVANIGKEFSILFLYLCVSSMLLLIICISKISRVYYRNIPISQRCMDLPL